MRKKIILGCLTGIFLVLIWMGVRTSIVLADRFLSSYNEIKGVLITPYATFTPSPTTTPTPEILPSNTPTPVAKITFAPLATPVASLPDQITQASYYSQARLVQSRKNLAVDSYGAASALYRLGTRLSVCSISNGRCILVTINDYCAGCGSIFPNRHLDLSIEAFKQLAPLKLGVTMVKVYEL